ncbi:MAG: MFS transporter [Pseudomonadota bacterium]
MVSSPIRVSLFVGVVFLSLGIYLPFFPLWLKSQLYSPSEIAILLAIPLLVRVLLTPLATAAVGRARERRGVAVVYCFLSLVFFAALALDFGFWSTAIALGLFGVFWHALIPIGDSFALTEVRQHQANYGTIRLWGSVSFILANLGAGILIAQYAETPGWVIFVVICAALAGATASAFALPRYGLPASERPKTDIPIWFDLKRFLVDRRFLLIALSGGFTQASHAMLYSFGTLLWVERGYTLREIGIFWAVGVLAEIVLFTQARGLFSKIGPALLLAIGGLAGALRWVLHDDVDGFYLIVALQMLHGLSFGATHLGNQAFIAAHVSEDDTPSAQGALVFVSGLIMALFTMASGLLYAQFGSQAFMAMSITCLCGLAALFLLRYPHKARSAG